VTAGPDAVNLTLLVGPVVPLPAPRWVVDSLTDVTVNATAVPGQDSGFELTFTLDKNSALPTIFLLAGGTIPPIFRVVVMVTMGGLPEVLIDGMMTQTQLQPGGDGKRSTFTVKGVDLSAAMGFIDFTGFPFPAMPVEARVLLIVAKYAFLGLIPVVVPSIVPEVPNPLDRIPAQQGTDLAYLRRLADRTGYIFTIIPGPVPGTSFAYWGPEAKIGLVQPALNVDMDALTNVQSLSFTFEGEKATLPVIFLQNQETRVIFPIPIPNVSPLNPPLGLVPPIPKRVRFLRDTAKLSIPQAILLGLAKASRTSDVVKATGALDVLRYGRVLKPRGLVGVRGAGLAFDGLYFVQQVQHIIKRGAFEQRFTLVRNGLISTLPVVPV
jgi:hypothetical protein